jgi:hypothetical protein
LHKQGIYGNLPEIARPLTGTRRIEMRKPHLIINGDDITHNGFIRIVFENGAKELDIPASEFDKLMPEYGRDLPQNENKPPKLEKH